MSPKERIIAIRLAERIKQNPKYAKSIGVSLKFKQGVQNKTVITEAVKGIK